MTRPRPTEDGARGARTVRVGVDIGGTTTVAVAIDGAQREVGIAELPTPRGGSAVAETAAEAARSAARAAGAGLRDIASVGLGVPGVVRPVPGTVHHAVNLGIADEPLPIVAMVSSRVGGVRTAVENDLGAAALGAASLAPTQDEPVDLAYLALGTGMAAGFVLDGRLRRGAAGVAGEIGHVVLDEDGPLCPCGQRGCLELYVSGTAIAGRWPVAPGLHPGAELVAAVVGGDPRADAVWRRFTTAVAAAVRLVVLTVDVPSVVIGGGVARMGRPLLDGVRAALADDAARSPFLASLGLAERVTLAPDRPVAAIGAALLPQAPEGPRPAVAATGERIAAPS